MTHPQAKPDCPGDLETTPHYSFSLNCLGWRCLHCLVYGKLLKDGAMTCDGDVHKATAEELREGMKRAADGLDALA